MPEISASPFPYATLQASGQASKMSATVAFRLVALLTMSKGPSKLHNPVYRVKVERSSNVLAWSWLESVFGNVKPVAN